MVNKSSIDELIGELTASLVHREPNDTEVVNNLIDTVYINLNAVVSFGGDLRRLIIAIKQTLATSADEKLDYNSLIALLDVIIRLSQFEDVLDTFSVDDLIMALESPLTPLVQSACRIIAASYPKDIFATTSIFDILLKLYFKDHTAVANSIEKVLQNLCCNELVRRRILKNNFPLLKSMRESSDPIHFSRLLELLTILFQHIDYSEFQKDLFILSPDEIKLSLYKDIFLFINITKYYQSLVELAGQPKIGTALKHWALNYIIPNLPVFGYIYKQRDRYIDVHNFATGYLFQLFKTISHLDDFEVFHEIDAEYIHINIDNPDVLQILATVNPLYFVKYCPDLLKSHVFVKPSHLQVLDNIISYPESFELIKPTVTSAAVLAMPYTEQMLFLEQLSSRPHSATYLIENLPKPMSNLISNGNGPVTDMQTIEIRRKVFENLLKCGTGILNVWYEPLLNEYSNICAGINSGAALAQVTSSYL